jgi:hypothetical protein
MGPILEKAAHGEGCFALAIEWRLWLAHRSFLRRPF